MLNKKTLEPGSFEWYQYHAPIGVVVEGTGTIERDYRHLEVRFIIHLNEINSPLSLVQKRCAELVLPGWDWMMIIKP